MKWASCLVWPVVGVKRGVLFDGSHVGHKKSEPATQIEVSLGGTHEGSPTPAMGPHSAAARSRRSDTRLPPGKPGGDVA